MKQKRNWLLLFFTLLTVLSTSGAVRAEETDESVSASPYFFIEGADTATDRMPLKETSVSTTISGVIADTYVTQVYTNEGQNPINASYIFPASNNAAVHGMTMQIGDQMVSAQIKEKEEAKEVFEEAKSEGKSTSLLEQHRPNVFSMNIANIMPGDEVTIVLHYTELIEPTEGIYQYVFPTVVGPRYASSSDDDTDAQADPWTAAPYIKEEDVSASAYNIDVKVSAAVPITDLTCKTHEIKKAWNQDKTTATVQLADPQNTAGNRDYILEYKLTGDEVSSGLMLYEGEDENFFLLMVQPPEHYEPEDIPPREYIFVLDVSGSMSGYPLDTAKVLIRNLVGGLRETDSFNVILFSGDSRQMAPKSLPATAENIKIAVNMIDWQNGGGGTELAPALTDAINMPRNRDTARSIVVVTDGYISGEKEIFDIIQKNLNTTSFFSFGIGSSVNRYLIDGIADTGQGEAFVVTDETEAEDTAKRFRTYIEAPLLTDIQLIYKSFEVYDIQPAIQPTLFAQRPVIVYGKWRGEAAGSIQVTGKTGSSDYSQDILVSEVQPLESNQAISYLWARKKIEQLTDYNYRSGDQEAIQKEVTELGLKYSMMTAYTSFVAVIDTVRNTTGESTDVTQPLAKPLEVSDLAFGSYTSGSEPGMGFLLAGIAVVFASGMITRRKQYWRRKEV